MFAIHLIISRLIFADIRGERLYKLSDCISLLPSTLPKSKQDLDIGISASNSKSVHHSERSRMLGKHISEHKNQMKRKE